MRELEQVHAIVHGKVQGVSFRYHTAETANRLGVVGWVRNLPSRTVEVVAEGTRIALDEFIAFLHTGPTYAHVERVEIMWGTPSYKFETFSITR